MTAHLTDRGWDRLWEAIAEVRDQHPRMPNDAPTDVVVDTILPIIAAEAEEKISEEKALRMKAVAAATEAEADRDEWRQTALEERAAALDLIEQVKVRDAQIEAVQEVLDGNRQPTDRIGDLYGAINSVLKTELSASERQSDSFRREDRMHRYQADDDVTQAQDNEREYKERIESAIKILDEDVRWQNDEHILARVRQALL